MSTAPDCPFCEKSTASTDSDTGSTTDLSHKWSAFLGDIPQNREAVAYVIEQELAYLHEYTADPSTPTIGSALKIVVPAIRESAARLLNRSAIDRLALAAKGSGQLTLKTVHVVFEEVFEHLKQKLTLEEDFEGRSAMWKRDVTRRLFQSLQEATCRDE